MPGTGLPPFPHDSRRISSHYEYTKGFKSPHVVPQKAIHLLGPWLVGSYCHKGSGEGQQGRDLNAVETADFSGFNDKKKLTGRQVQVQVISLTLIFMTIGH